MNVTQDNHAAAAVRGDARPAQHTRSGAVVSILLGALIIYGVGFAPGILHGSLHDSRHTLGFVCH